MSLPGINGFNPMFRTTQQRFSGNITPPPISNPQNLTTQQLLTLYGTSGYAALSGLDEAIVRQHGSSVGQQFPENESQLRQKLSS